MSVKTEDMVLLLICAAISLILAYYYRRNPEQRPVSGDTKESGDTEEFGYPKIEACTEALEQIKPIPYRPFRWGDYHVTMGIRSMDWNSWIELDQQYSNYYRIRDYRVRTRKDKLVKTMDAQPGVVSSGHEAAKELVYELAEYLSRRYPEVFIVTRHSVTERLENGWYGLGLIHTITIVPVNRTLDLDAEDPMTVSALLIQDDLAIMLEGSDGRYYLQAGAIVIPGTWRLEDKAGMPLDEIHTSGDVPLYREKLHLSLGRFFKRMQVDKPVIRNNYTFQLLDPATRTNPDEQIDPEELAWAATMLGNEDHPSSTHPPQPKPENIRLRTERQTLRRLPKTGAIVFTIRTYITPVEDLAREPGVPGRLASAIRSWPELVARYKHSELFEPVLLNYLDGWHKTQFDRGVTNITSEYPW